MTLVGLAARKLAQKQRTAKLSAAFPNGIRCQKCLNLGHWSYECKEKRKYVHRSSRTKQLSKHLAEKIANSVETESRAAEAGAVARIDREKRNKHKTKRSHSSSSSSSSDSSNSSSDSSNSDSSSSDDSDSSSSDDDSSSGGESGSSSDSDSDGSSSSSKSSGSSAAPKKKIRRDSTGESSEDNAQNV